MSVTSSGQRLVAVIPKQRYLGADSVSLAETTPRAEVVTLQDALTRRWTDDNHILLYMLHPFAPGDGAVRWNKPALLSIRQANYDLLLERIYIEYDNPGHRPWTPELWRTFQNLMFDAEQGPLRPILDSAFAYYGTRRGVRWGFELATPLPVDQGEGYIRGLAAAFHAGGLPVDLHGSVLNWAQPFRLPHVYRDGKRTDDDPFFFCELRDRLLDLSLVKPVEKQKGYVKRVAGPEPDRDFARSLIWSVGGGSGGNTVLTSVGRAIRQRMQNREAGDACFEHSPIILNVPAGSRHDVLLGWVSSLISLANDVPDVTAAHVFGCFIDVAEQFDAMPGAREFTLNEAWRIVTDIWDKQQAENEKKALEEQAKEEARDQQVAAFVQQKKDLSETVLEGVKSWHPKIATDAPTAWEWVQRRAVAAWEGRYFVLRPDGRYCENDVPPAGVLAQIEHLGMSALVPTQIETKQGPRATPLSELSRSHVVNVCPDVIFRPQIDGGYLQNPEATNPTLVVPSFRRRTDLEPRFDPGVDEWLRSWAWVEMKNDVWEWRQDVFDALCKQIGCFLAVERGAVAAISLLAPNDAGKKLMGMGIVECFEKADFATARDLSEGFNGKLLRAPLLWANEGAVLRWGFHHPSDTFRTIVTGDGFAVNRKHKEIVNVRYPVRVLFTANNEKLILQLCHGRDLAPEDRLAIAVRLRHYAPGHHPCELLERRGRMKWTKGWIAGDSSQPSNFVVARHFLWLWLQFGMNAEPNDAHGLLLAGDLRSSIIRRMQVQGGSTPAVIEALVKMLGSARVQSMLASPNDRADVMIANDRLYVTASAILDFWRENLTKGTSERLTTTKVQNALKGIGSAGAKDRGRWREIDVETVVDEARHAGWVLPSALEQLYARRAALALPMGVHQTVGMNGNGVHVGIPAEMGR